MAGGVPLRAAPHYRLGLILGLIFVALVTEVGAVLGAVVGYGFRSHTRSVGSQHSNETKLQEIS